MKNTIWIVLACLLSSSLYGQWLTGIHSQFNDSFVDWTIYTADEDVEGELRLRYRNFGSLGQDDWREWDYQVDDLPGSIRQKWRDRLDEWELRSDNRIVTARTRFPRDFSQWRITDGDRVFILRPRSHFGGNEWIVDADDLGYFLIYPEFSNDPRDWIIEDQLEAEVSFQAKMMMLFLALFQSIPKI